MHLLVSLMVDLPRCTTPPLIYFNFPGRMAHRSGSVSSRLAPKSEYFDILIYFNFLGRIGDASISVTHG